MTAESLKLRCLPKVEITRNGRFLECTATCPDGYSWGGLHQLVESWMVARVTKKEREALAKVMEYRVKQQEPMRPCPADCECLCSWRGKDNFDCTCGRSEGQHHPDCPQWDSHR